MEASEAIPDLAIPISTPPQHITPCRQDGKCVYCAPTPGSEQIHDAPNEAMEITYILSTPPQHITPCRQDGNCVLCAPCPDLDLLFGTDPITAHEILTVPIATVTPCIQDGNCILCVPCTEKDPLIYKGFQVLTNMEEATTAQGLPAVPPPQQQVTFNPCLQDGNCVLCVPCTDVDQLFGPEFKSLQAKEQAKKKRKRMKTVKRPAQVRDELHSGNEPSMQLAQSPQSPPRRTKHAKISPAIEKACLLPIQETVPVSRLPSDLLFDGTEEANGALLSPQKRKASDLPEDNEPKRLMSAIVEDMPVQIEDIYPTNLDLPASIHLQLDDQTQEKVLTSILIGEPVPPIPVSLPTAHLTPNNWSPLPMAALDIEHVSPTQMAPPMAQKRKFLGIKKRKHPESPEEDIPIKRYNGGAGTRFQVRIINAEPQSVYVAESDLSDTGSAQDEIEILSSSFVPSSIPDERKKQFCHKPNSHPLQEGQDNHKMIMKMAYGIQDKSPHAVHPKIATVENHEIASTTTTELLSIITESRRKSLGLSKPSFVHVRPHSPPNQKKSPPILDRANGTILTLGQRLSGCSLLEKNTNESQSHSIAQVKNATVPKGHVNDTSIMSSKSSMTCEDAPASFLEGIDAFEKKCIGYYADLEQQKAWIARQEAEAIKHVPNSNEYDDDALYESPSTPNLPVAPEATVTSEPSSDPAGSASMFPTAHTQSLPAQNSFASSTARTQGISRKPIAFRLIREFSWQPSGNDAPVSAMTLDQIVELLKDMMQESGVINVTFSN